MVAQLLPNDPSLNQQPYLANTAAAISAFGAWDISTGRSSVIVAVVDTGYRPHAGISGRFLPGYDFVSETASSNDGDARDADALDPGDWVTTADINGPLRGEGCSVSNSSWHGTRVAGILGGALIGFVIAGNSDDLKRPDLTLSRGQTLHLELGEDLAVQ